MSVSQVARKPIGEEKGGFGAISGFEGEERRAAQARRRGVTFSLIDETTARRRQSIPSSTLSAAN
ncbi:protein of unknown function [Pararobbsia alpina]